MAFIEHALADDRLLREQALDVAGSLYLLVLGLLATDALDLLDSALERMLADARAGPLSRHRRSSSPIAVGPRFGAGRWLKPRRTRDGAGAAHGL